MSHSPRVAILALILAVSLATSGAAALQDLEADANEITTGVSNLVSQQVQSASSQTRAESISMLSGSNFECSEGDELLAKYNLEDEDGDGVEDTFVFEKGSAGDVFEFTSVETNSDGVIDFTWESTAPLVIEAYAKDDGPTTPDWNETFDPPTRGPVDVPDADKAYSNVQFCGEAVYQIDLIEGTPADPLEEEDRYRPQDRLVKAAFGSAAGNILDRGSQNSPASKCVDVTDPISVDHSDKNATVTFEITDAAGCDGTTISFAGYDLPGENRGFALPQDLTDSTSITIGSGVGPGDTVTLEISLE